MQHMIALVDGSEYAQSVCDYAGWMATQNQSSLLLLHVLGSRQSSANSTDYSGSIGLGARSALLEELAELDAQKARLVNKRGRAILEDAKARTEVFGVTDVSTMLRTGQLIDTMEDLEQQTDLIVIGKRGEGSNYNPEHLGSNLERLVRATKKPVLVASRAYRPVNKVLIAFDGGTSSIKAVDHISRHNTFRNSQIVLIQVGNESTANCKPLWGAVAALKEAGFNADSTVVPGQADKVISDTIESQGYDMLVMGAYGHSRIRNLIIGSTTTQMISSCKVPILLFR